MRDQWHACNACTTSRLYLDEQAFRYNYRNDMKDGDRFELAASQIIGKRLTYAEVTGKAGETTLN